ncbi:hypothetical protein EUGRSUZ_G01364 [Eucalyptus grandis]|uniref:Uncharacterized protein n=2 Tax=Eucalyptus grandis TaxID=71139 RepID=A0ACC3K4X9_EUCGR|nr:hypothetical protein EUGRSUZ_G01364 [Eucalyptus grandis]
MRQTLTRLHRNRSLHIVPGHGRQEGDRAPVLVRRGQVHIVDPTPGDPDHLQPPAGAAKHVPAHLHLAPDDERITPADPRAQLLGCEVNGVVNLREIPEDIQPRFPELGGGEGRNLKSSDGGFIGES